MNGGRREGGIWEVQKIKQMCATEIQRSSGGQEQVGHSTSAQNVTCTEKTKKGTVFLYYSNSLTFSRAPIRLMAELVEHLGRDYCAKN